jgi:transcriptional regulator with GAF, ATPase, and Fis domain
LDFNAEISLMAWQPSNWKKLFLVLAGTAVLGYSIILLAYVTSTPDIGLHCAFTSAIKHINPDYLRKEEGQMLPEEGDVLVRVGGMPIDREGTKLWGQIRLLRRLFELRNQPPGTNPNVKQIGDETWVLASFRPADSNDLDDVREIWCRLGTSSLAELIPSILWFFLKIGLFAVGALVFWKRPDDRAARQFFLLCIVTLGAYMGGYHWLRISTQRELLLIFMVCGVLLPPVSLHFYLVFPRPKQFLEQSPRMAMALIYGPPLAFLVAMIPTYLAVRSAVPRDGVANLAQFDRVWSTFQIEVGVYLLLAAAWYVTSVICLVHSFRAALDVAERNQVKWIMVGSIVALLPIGYTLFLVMWARDDFGSGAATWPMFLASVCLTVAFGVSITRYRLMQLDQLVSSGAVYFLISTLAVLVYYAVVFIGMVVTDVVVGSRVISGPSFLQSLGVGASFLVFMLLLDFARSRIKKALDRRFYKEKYQLDRTLTRMGKAIEQLVDPPTLARGLLQASAELLNVSWGVVYLRDGNPPLYKLVGSLGAAPPLAELAAGCPLVEAVKAHGFLVVRSSASVVLDPAQRQLRLVGGEVAHALAHEGQLLAILVLGPKTMGLYGSDDLNLLSAFAQLTALALESAERHRTIEALNRDLSDKVDKISEQQRRILALQSQLTRQTTTTQAGKDGNHANGTASPPTEAPAPLPGGIIGSSPAVRHLLELMRKVSATQSAVLIRGESGTGKELLARALHENSPRAGKPYVKVHCAALSATLLESELFGHVKGAFTGAHKDKIGRFELANGGTLFLDEIGDISLEVQTKLLRVLQEKTFERVGSSEPLQVDVRIVAATHQNLEALIRQGRFREDLYYRLKVIDIAVPSLRERREDIPELALHFLNVYATRFNRPVNQIDDDAMVILKAYRWQGNIRELENVMERAAVVTEGPAIGVNDLPEEITQAVAAERPIFVGSGVRAIEPYPVDRMRGERHERELRERERLVRALAAARGNKAEAARALGVARSTLVSRLKKFGLS